MLELLVFLCLRQQYRRRHRVLVRPADRPSVNTYLEWRNISVVSECISLKLATNVRHMI